MKTHINPIDDDFIRAKFKAFSQAQKEEEQLNSKRNKEFVYTREQNKLEVKYHTNNKYDHHNQKSS